MNEARREGPRRHLDRPGARASAAVVMVGLVVTLALVAWQWSAADTAARERLATQPVTVAESTHTALSTVTDRLVSVGGLFRASDDVTKAEFDQFVADIRLVPGMEAMGLALVVPGFDLVDFEAALAAEGSSSPVFQIDDQGMPVPRQPAAVFYPIRFAYPDLPWGEYRGLDLGSPHVFGPDFAAAVATGEVRMTDFLPVAGREDDDLFALVLPVDEPASGAVFGFAVALMDATDLLTANLPTGLDRFVDWNLHSMSDGQPDPGTASAELEYGGRSWLITVTPKPGSPFLPARQSILIVAVLGVVASLLAGLSVLLMAQRRRASSQLAREREITAAKDRLIASISHELRTPLTGVMGFAEVLQHSPEAGPEERDEMLRTIATQAEDLSHIIDDLLVAARGVIGDVHVDATPMPVSELMDTLAVAGVLEGVTIRNRTTPDQAVVADPLRVRQIVRNLLDNARQHGGDRIELEVVPDDAVVRLSVVDDGPGIPVERVAEMFEPYGVAGGDAGVPASIGIGLSVSQMLATTMGGGIVYERRGNLTVFSLTLRALAAVGR